MISGGDDNAIHLSEIGITDIISRRLLGSEEKAHSSTVTGLLSLGDSTYISIGIDQRIRVWAFRDGQITCIFEAYTFVPDVCGMVEIDGNQHKRRFIAYGTGMELFALTRGV
jgi:hypothetical protein